MPVRGKTDGGTVKVTGTCACKAWDMAFLPPNCIFEYTDELAVDLTRA